MFPAYSFWRRGALYFLETLAGINATVTCQWHLGKRDFSRGIGSVSFFC